MGYIHNQYRGLIVGQSPPLKPPIGYKPFQGQPESKLARLAGLENPEALWTVFDRIDLLGWCPGPKDRKDYHRPSIGYTKHMCDGHKFPQRDAKIVAERLLHFGQLSRYALVVLCGRLVASAFSLRLRAVPWAEECEGVRFLVMPHPSGVSHYWNDPMSWQRAAGTFRAALKLAGLLGILLDTDAAMLSRAPVIKAKTARRKRRQQRPGHLKQQAVTRETRKATAMSGSAAAQPSKHPLVQSKFFA
jgi:hypothetical protein